MGRKSHKEVISLVCCSDSTFAEFEKFVVRWKKGEVLDVHGVVGPVENERGIKVDRDFSQLSVNRFRPVNGLLDSDLRLVWTQLEKGTVWVFRPAKLPEGLKLPEHSVSLKDYCKMLKGKRALALRILRYWETRFHCAKHGETAPQRLEPLEILRIKDISQYQLTLDEKLSCKLVFLDLTHPDILAWGRQEFSCFLDIVRELTVATEFAIVAIMDFGQQLVDFCTKLKEMKDARVIIECGCYETPRLHREVEFSFPCWQLVYALISLGSQDYQPSLKDSVQMRPYSMEYQPKGAGEDFVEEKRTASAAIQTNIKIKAPQWGFVSMASPDGSAHRDVIYFANSQEEAEFIGKYGKSLLNYSERVKHWFAKYKSAKKHASTIQQAVILAKEHANTQDDHILADKKEQPSFVFDEVFTTDALERLGPLALTQMSMCLAPEFMQIDNTLVKASDLLPRKLLILDIEGLLVYVEGFMERTAKTAAGDAIGSKKCEALDTNERWTRNNQQIRLLLKPLKTVWERFPNFNARNTLLVDIHPFRASANPEDTGIFLVPYTGSHSDTYLTTVLLLYLEGLSQAFDIREYVREHVLQGSQRPLHFRATSRGLPGLLHKYSLRAIETYVPTLLTKRGNLTDFEKSVLSRLPDIDELEDHDYVAWARLLGLSWNQALQDDLTTIGVSDEKHTRTKASVKYARDFLVEVKNVHLA
ncbi:hypothetical protein R1sor_014780 [Riccia sorocarpa]|uniref:Uncharacterized protein n=1 Tax=Riccia sorocarpa TaxID=122646 RepID=A0ABD3HC83_9MARC